MSRRNLEDGSISNAQDFRAVLAEAVERALEADVDVRGAWEFETAGSTLHWELEVSELARDHGPE